ncbi:porin [Ralstonia soli]|uniref:Porin n=1 Tax=Ralstonia soli TaxID=2953896 RepID=A0ABT1ATE6_9RALS|nr:porin [Ralstonia soli]MCO5401721.1 porin [Ralstonia soli]
MQCNKIGGYLFAVTMGCAASTAMAQSSVTLYGIIDDGLQFRNKSANNSGSQTEIMTGGSAMSIWGLKGVEPLGDGMKAFFNLESHFYSDTGKLFSGPDNGSQIFRRQANVGLSADWGTITLGRQYGPALMGVLGTEARTFKEQFSNLYVWAYNQLATPTGSLGSGTNPGNDVGVFVGNAVQYSNNFGPVWVGAAYSFGEVPGSMSKGNEISLGATYTGPVTVGLAYQAMKDSTSGSTVSRLWSAGVAAPLGDTFKGRLNYLNITDNATAGGRISKVQSVGAGVDYQWNASNTATLAGYYSHYESDSHSSSTKTFVLSNDYALSKRTTLYAQVAYADAGAIGTADPLEGLKTSIVSGGTAPGVKTVLAGVGLKHAF